MQSACVEKVTNRLLIKNKSLINEIVVLGFGLGTTPLDTTLEF